MTAALRKGWCPGALRPMPAKDGLLVRLRITGGILTAANAYALPDLAERCGSGLFDLSGRGNLQMRGVREDALARLRDGLLALGLLDADAGAEAVRNVISSPLAGLHEGLDIRPLVTALEKRLVKDAALHVLPAKFGFLVDDGSRPTLANVEADVRFDWDGEGFTIGLGGGDENCAARLGWCTAARVVEEAARIANVFLELSAHMPGIRRMRDLDQDVFQDVLLSSPSPACGRRRPDEVGSNEGTFHPLKKDQRSGTVPHPPRLRLGTFSRKREKEGAYHTVRLHTFGTMPVLGLAAPFGRLDAAMLRAAARLAESTNVGELRLTPWRVILVPGTTKDVEIPGFITDPADPRLATAACVGADGCARGTTHTQRDAARLAQDLLLDSRDGVTLHVSGCAKGCAKASASPITLVAENGRYDVVRHGCAGDTPWRRGLAREEVRDVLDAITATA